MVRNEIVVCKKSLPVFTSKEELRFVKNETYRIVEIKQGMVILVNINNGDQGTINPGYFEDYFISIKEMRKQKLDEIDGKTNN